jgi:hypothetical protein
MECPACNDDCISLWQVSRAGYCSRGKCSNCGSRFFPAFSVVFLTAVIASYVFLLISMAAAFLFSSVLWFAAGILSAFGYAVVISKYCKWVSVSAS